MFSYLKFYSCFKVGPGTILRIVCRSKQRNNGDVGVSRSLLRFQSLIFLYFKLGKVFIFFSLFSRISVGRFA
jgi:hypothetical protein